MQPLQYDLRCPAAKDNSITHAAAAPSNLDAASCKTQQNYAQERRQNPPELSVPLRGRSDHDPTLAERVPQQPAGQASPSIFRDTFCPAKHSISCGPLTFKNAFRARLPSKSESGRCENEAFVQDSLKMWLLKMWKRSFRARLPSKSESWRCEIEAFVRDFPQNVKVEDAKTKLSCETSLQMWLLKMWKRSFRAILPSKSESWRCENEAFVRDSPQNLEVEDVKTTLSCKTSFKFWKFKWWTWSQINFQFHHGADPGIILV